MSSRTLDIAQMLRGCRPGRVQAVGLMQVIPLLSDLHDDRFAAPSDAEVGTTSYGTLVFKNTRSDKPVLLPAGATYIVDQAAQNHALPHAGLIKQKESKSYKTAMCVQQSQGGYIRAGKHELMLMPLPLREQAYQLRRNQGYSRFWPAIEQFNQRAGCLRGTGRGHLEDFFTAYKDQLDAFVAEFEPVPNQVGAIFVIDGKVVGVERTPSQTYFQSIWRPLVRECYGAMAAVLAKNGATPKPPRTRVPVRKARNLADLVVALEQSEREEHNRIAALVANITALSLTVQPEELVTDLRVEGVEGKNFVGQMISDGEKIVYASITAREQWQQHEDWLLAQDFAMARK